MSAIPSSLPRVSNMLGAQIILSTLARTNQDLLNQQIKLSTGKEVNRPSDDAGAASTISVLDDIIELREQHRRNLNHAQAVLNTTDGSLADASELLMEARTIGLGQIGVGSDGPTRANQAQVIDAILREMTAIANRSYQDIHLFGGSQTAGDPLVELLQGLRYTGDRNGALTDLGSLRGVPITISGDTAFGSLSRRVQGDRDLDPDMALNTRLVDLGGARDLGITLGTIDVTVNGTGLTVDLTGAHTIGDVIATLNTAIQAVDAGALVDIDPATGNRLRVTAAAGVITIADTAVPATAADLGLTGTYPVGTTAAQDLNPALTELTPVSLLTGVTVPMGTIRVTNGGQTRDVDLSGAQTIQDIMNAVEGLNIGVRVEIAATGDRLDFINELSAVPTSAMSIAEVAGGLTATELGVRSLAGTTLLADFNHGRGVQIIDGSVNPVTGLPDPTMDREFRITLKNGVAFDVDLSTETTVQDVINTINAAAVGAGVAVPATFQAGLAADGNGLTFTDNSVGPPGTFSIAELNNATTATDLGILGSTTGATFTGTDRATVAVESAFAHLIALRDALLSDDRRGIELATQRLEADVSRVAEARATVGVRSRRVDDALTREEDLMIQDKSLRSQVQDLDVAAAAVRFSQLQQQLQAGLATAARITSLSLLDFLA